MVQGIIDIRLQLTHNGSNFSSWSFHCWPCPLKWAQLPQRKRHFISYHPTTPWHPLSPWLLALTKTTWLEILQAEVLGEEMVLMGTHCGPLMPPLAFVWTPDSPVGCRQFYTSLAFRCCPAENQVIGLLGLSLRLTTPGSLCIFCHCWGMEAAINIKRTDLILTIPNYAL